MEHYYSYEVWALGFDKNDQAIDFKKLLDTSGNAEWAKTVAAGYQTVKDVPGHEDLPEGGYVNIVVEVIEDNSTDSEDRIYDEFIY